MVAPAMHPTSQSQFIANRICPRIAAVTTAFPVAQLIAKNSLRH
jgi:hypothetical protein